jgi:hypothetical protein
MNQNAITNAMIRQIVARIRCATCGHRYSTSDVQVLGKRERAWAISLKCRECHTQALVLAVIDNGATHPIHTDLSPSEWERFAPSPAISVDDVIEFHAWMSLYDGDMSEIMDEPLPPE